MTKDLQKRLIFGAIALALFIPVLWVGGTFAQLVIALLAMVAVSELLRMRGLSVASLEGGLTLLGTLVLTLPLENYLVFLPTDGNYVAFSIVALLILGATVWQFGTYTFADAVYPIATSYFIGTGFHALVLAQMSGLSKLFFALLIVWFTDSGAYLIGSFFGRRKLIPKVSPNKTLEGFWGGILSALVMAAIYLLVFKEVKVYNYILMLLLTVMFSAAAQFGDLVESSLKRYFGVKDSGKVIPGHGGILDRFDSIIFVFPLMHFFGLF